MKIRDQFQFKLIESCIHVIGKAVICSQEELAVSPRGYECDSDTNSGVSIARPAKRFNSSCQQCIVERAACKRSSTNLNTLGITSPESSFAESSISSTAMMSPTRPKLITGTSERASYPTIQPSTGIQKRVTTTTPKKIPYIVSHIPVSSQVNNHQISSTTSPNVFTSIHTSIPLSNPHIQNSPRSMA